MEVGFGAEVETAGSGTGTAGGLLARREEACSSGGVDIVLAFRTRSSMFW